MKNAATDIIIWDVALYSETYIWNKTHFTSQISHLLTMCPHLYIKCYHLTYMILAQVRDLTLNPFLTANFTWCHVLPDTPFSYRAPKNQYHEYREEKENSTDPYHRNLLYRHQNLRVTSLFSKVLFNTQVH